MASADSSNIVILFFAEVPTNFCAITRSSAIKAVKNEHIALLVEEDLKQDYKSEIVEKAPAETPAEEVSPEAEAVEEARRNGIDKPVVASLVGDVEVEEASEYLFDHGIPAYPYTTEKPVAVLGAKYRWARSAGLIGS